MIEEVLEKNIRIFIPEEHLRDACLYSVLTGGKRLRPKLVLAFSELFNGKKSNALEAASAVEFVHCYSLIHDDLPMMDNDDYRRGKPTLHKKYNEATAILAGDSLLTLAFEVLSLDAAHDNPMIRCKMIETLSKASGGSGMVQGQFEDMGLSPYFDSKKEEEIQNMQFRKTGSLITASCILGALSASIEKKEILVKIKEYGMNIGFAFQLKDDLLDITSSREVMGKETGKDQKSSKATIPNKIGLEKSEELLKDKIEKANKILETIAPKDKIKPIMELTNFIARREF